MNYTEHSGRVVNTDEKFKHVMAITLDPRTNNTEGIIRCITSRSGDVLIKGYTDKSKLYRIQGSTLESFELTEPLLIKYEDKFIKELEGADGECIGLEDPDIWIDEKTDLMHVYFTIPIKYSPGWKKMHIHLGHAVGKDLDTLEMTEPMLLGDDKISAKEVSIAPLNTKGFRFNLVESKDRRKEQSYSTVRVAIAHDMGKPWEYGEVAFHPAEQDIPWIGEHASPGPLFPEDFINIGQGKRLGVINGRSASEKMKNGDVKYGTFSTGLFIYDYENGKIEWVSPEPLIRDSEAVTITFASQFVLTKPGEGILYAHVDDSFVRAYTLEAEKIRKLLPIEYN